MAESYKGQNIVRLVGEQIADVFIEVVVVVPGFDGQQLGFVGKNLSRADALLHAQAQARAFIDSKVQK